MSSGYNAKLIICYGLMLITYSGMDKKIHTKTSKYELQKSKSPMGVLKETILMIYHIAIIS